MKHNYRFESNRIILRPLEEKDIENVRKLRNAYAEFYVNQEEITEEQQKKWFAHYLTKEDDVMVVAELKDVPGSFAGATSLYDIDYEKKECEIGRTMCNKDVATEKGIGSEIFTAIIAMGFDTLGMKRIITSVLTNNPRSAHMTEKAGFKFYSGPDKDNLNWYEVTPEALERGILEGK